MDSVEKTGTTFDYRRYYALLVPYAYSIIGDSMAAEDVVQEILNQYMLAGRKDIQNPKSYLVRSVINRSINEKKKIKVRNDYNGQWLPSPINTEESIYGYTDRQHILEYSLLVLLERLNPKERAVFILKESFDFSHEEIGQIIGITIDNSRQLFKRAKHKLEPDLTKSFQSNELTGEIISQLSDAILNADIERVKSLLATDVRSLSDGGYKVKAAQKIIFGQQNVGKFLQAMYGKYLLPGTSTSTATLNHNPALLFKVEGRVYRSIIFEISDDKIESVFIVVNPEKLYSLQQEHLSR